MGRWRDFQSNFSDLWHHPLQLGCIGLTLFVAASAYLWIVSLSFLGPVGVILLTALLFCIWLRVSWFSRRQKLWDLTGHCTTCGYDLRATSAACPECGHGLPENLARMRRVRAHLLTARKATPSTTPPTVEEAKTHPEHSMEKNPPESHGGNGECG